MKLTTIKLQKKQSLVNYHRLFFVTVFIFNIFSFSSLAQSSEIPLKIKADKLKYVEKENKIIAIGSVEAEIENSIVKSDKMIVDTKENIGTAEGNVYISKERYTLFSQSLTFDLNREVSFLKHVFSTVRLEGAKSDVYLKAQNFNDFNEVKTGDIGSATTCDLDNPHYEIIASYFYFIPNDKLVAKSATIYLNGAPIFWLPFYVYNLAKRRVSLLMPIIGKNDVEGSFIKNELSYFVNNAFWGSLFLDLMSKKGNGYGIEHNYKIDKQNEGTLFLYNINEIDTKKNSLKTRLEHNLKLKKGAANIKYEYNDIYLVPSGRLDQTLFQSNINFTEGKNNYLFFLKTFNNRISSLNDFDFKTSFSTDSSLTEYFYSLRNSTSGSRWQNISQGIFINNKFFDNKLDTNLRVNYYRSLTFEGTPFDDRLEPLINLTYFGPFYTAKLSANYFLDVDKDAYPDDFKTEYIEKMPEFSISLTPQNFFGFNFYPEMSYSKIHESKYIYQLNTQRHFLTDKNRFYLGMDRTFDVGFNTKFSFNLAGEQFIYGTGDQKYAKKESYSLHTDNSKWFKNTIKYEKGVSEGNSPFYYDSLGFTYNSLRNTMVFYHGNEHRFTIDGGYNYLTNKYFDLLLNYRYFKGDDLNVNLTSGYDIEAKQWKDLVTVLGFSIAEKLKNDLSHTYDLRTGKTKNAVNVLRFEIGDSWQNRWSFRIGHSYDFALDAIILQEAEVIKDLHCWEAKFSYSNFRKEYKLVFTLKAFPNTPIGLVSGNQGFMIEGLMNSMENR